MSLFDLTIDKHSGHNSTLETFSCNDSSRPHLVEKFAHQRYNSRGREYTDLP